MEDILELIIELILNGKHFLLVLLLILGIFLIVSGTLAYLEYIF